VRGAQDFGLHDVQHIVEIVPWNGSQPGLGTAWVFTLIAPVAALPVAIAVAIRGPKPDLHYRNNAGRRE